MNRRFSYVTDQYSIALPYPIISRIAAISRQYSKILTVIRWILEAAPNSAKGTTNDSTKVIDFTRYLLLINVYPFFI